MTDEQEYELYRLQGYESGLFAAVKIVRALVYHHDEEGSGLHTRMGPNEIVEVLQRAAKVARRSAWCAAARMDEPQGKPGATT